MADPKRKKFLGFLGLSLNFWVQKMRTTYKKMMRQRADPCVRDYSTLIFIGLPQYGQTICGCGFSSAKKSLTLHPISDEIFSRSASVMRGLLIVRLRCVCAIPISAAMPEIVLPCSFATALIFSAKIIITKYVLCSFVRKDTTLFDIYQISSYLLKSI